MFFTTEGGGNAVLFLHGWGCNSSIWQQQMQLLRHKYRVFAVDLAGFGNSAPPDKVVGSYYYAHATAELMNKLRLQNCVVVGHSFGGKVAIILSACYPRLTAGLILANSAGINRKPLLTRLKILRYKLIKALRISKKKPDNATLKHASDDYKAAKGVMRGVLCKVVNEDVRVKAKQITCPTLLIYGSNDSATPYSQGVKLHKKIRNSAIITLGKGHYSYLEAPHAFAAVVDNFATSLYGRNGE